MGTGAMRAAQRLGRQLQRLRTRRGLTQEQLAVNVGLSGRQREHSPFLGASAGCLRRCWSGTRTLRRCSFDEALDRMTKAAEKFNPGKIKESDLASSGGAPGDGV